MSTETTVNVSAARVQAGAAHLDKNIPNWIDSMPQNPNDLVMSSTCGCVLGNIAMDIAGEYEEEGTFTDLVICSHEPSTSAVWHNIPVLTIPQAIDFGFEVPAHTDSCDDTEDYYEILRVEWIKIINERRSGEQL